MARDEIPDSDSGFSSDDDELPSLDALFKSRNGDAGSVFTRSARVLSSDPLRPEEDRQERWESFMELIKDGEDDVLVVDNAPVAAAQLPRRPSIAASNKSDDDDAGHLFDEAVNLVKGSEDVDMDSDEDQHWGRVRQAMDRQASTRAAPFYYFFKETGEPQKVIKCTCGFNGENGSAVYCETCETWQHIHCTYPDHEDEAGQLGFPHWCVDCKPPPRPFLQYAHDKYNPARPLHFGLALQTELASKFSNTGIAINVPDELLLWIFRAYPSERSARTRADYSRVLLDNPRRVRDAVDDEQVKRWFLRSGGDKDAIILRAKGIIAKQRKSEIERDWRPFQNVLELLRTCCSCFRTQALISAVVLLLRASMDSEVRVNAAISAAIVETLSILISSVHETRREYFCEKVCGLFIPSVNSGYILSRAVEATSHFTPIVFETSSADKFPSSRHLRIRLQLAVFFHSPNGNHHTLSLTQLLESILDRLQHTSFKARPGARGDFNCYDVDGYGFALSELLPYCCLLRGREKDKAKLQEIDDLLNMVRAKVNWINSSIQIQGPQGDYDVRYEAKARLSYLDQRMSYFFPRKNTGVFTNTDREEAERKALKAQQDLMANFTKIKEDVPRSTKADINSAAPTAKKVDFDDKPLVLGSPRRPMKIGPSPSPRKPRSGPNFMARLRNAKRKAPGANPEGDENTQHAVRRLLYEKKEEPEEMDREEEEDPATPPVPASPEHLEEAEWLGFDGAMEMDSEPAPEEEDKLEEASMVSAVSAVSAVPASAEHIIQLGGPMQLDTEPALEEDDLELRIEADPRGQRQEAKSVVPAVPGSSEDKKEPERSARLGAGTEMDTESRSAPQISKRVELSKTEMISDEPDIVKKASAQKVEKKPASRVLDPTSAVGAFFKRHWPKMRDALPD